MTPPTITHHTVPLSLHNNKMFRHSAILCITHEETTASASHNTTNQEKQILQQLYLPLEAELTEIRPLFSLDPTQALRRFDLLLSQLHNQLH
jgi:hypothetical protein